MCVTNSFNRRQRTIQFRACDVASGSTTAVPESTVAASSSPEKRVDSAPLAVPQFAVSGLPGCNAPTYSEGISFFNAPSEWSGESELESSLSMPIVDNYKQKPESKPARPKRRRKPQKPGKTAKMNDRHFVVHNYHDHAKDQPDEEDLEHMQANKRRGGVSISFPLKLHAMLDQIEADGLAHVISWQPHGRAFVVHKPQEFVSHVMPTYFRQTKLTSFQRQLNLYGFCRLTKGDDNRGYYHELFLRGKPFLCRKMIRTKVKGTKYKAASSPDAEPDFYKMPPVVVTPPTSGVSDQDSTTDSDSTCSFMVQASSMMRSPVASFDAAAAAPIPDEAFAMAPMSPVSPLPIRNVQHLMMYQEPPPVPSLNHQVPQTIDFQNQQVEFSSDEEDPIDDVLINALGMDDFTKTWGGSDSVAKDSGSMGSLDMDEVFRIEDEQLENDYQLGCLLEQFLSD